MRNLAVQFSLFSACVLNLVPFSIPFSAQAQLTVNTTQNAAISGNNNQVTQVVNQTIIYRSQNSGRSFDRNNRNEQKNSGDDGDEREHHHRRHGGWRHNGEGERE
jgi:hypothetical protein